MPQRESLSLSAAVLFPFPWVGKHSGHFEILFPPLGQCTGFGFFHFVYPMIVTARGMHLSYRPIRLRMASLLSGAWRKVASSLRSHCSHRASGNGEDQDVALSHDTRQLGAKRGRRAAPATGWGSERTGTRPGSHCQLVMKLEVVTENWSFWLQAHTLSHLVLSWSR